MGDKPDPNTWSPDVILDTPAELAHGQALQTLEGGSVKGAKMGSVYEVNNAQVICGNIQTANATVYVINKVLVPMH